MYIASFRLKPVRAPSGAQCYFGGGYGKAHISLLTELEDAFSIPSYIHSTPDGAMTWITQSEH
jgi:hypothetical protein